MIDFEDNFGDEVGFAWAALIPLVTEMMKSEGGKEGGEGGKEGGGGMLSKLLPPILGGMLGGGDDKGAPASGAAVSPFPGLGLEEKLAQVSKLASAAQASGAPIKQQVIEALNEVQANAAKRQAAGNQVVSKLSPEVQNILGTATMAATQRQATHEHNVLMTDSERWRTSAQSQQAILGRLSTIEQILGGRVAVLRGRAIDIMGGAALVRR